MGCCCSLFFHLDASFGPVTGISEDTTADRGFDVFCRKIWPGKWARNPMMADVVEGSGAAESPFGLLNSIRKLGNPEGMVWKCTRVDKATHKLAFELEPSENTFVKDGLRLYKGTIEFRSWDSKAKTESASGMACKIYISIDMAFAGCTPCLHYASSCTGSVRRRLLQEHTEPLLDEVDVWIDACKREQSNVTSAAI